MKKQILHRYQTFTFIFTLLITLFIGNIPSHALKVDEVPNPRQKNGAWVTDMVDMLSPQAETKLNQMISELENKNGTEIAVVTVPTTKPSATPKQFTTKLFNTWGIGKKGKDNGVLFLVSKGDRRTEIETGYGIESILTDAKVGVILRKQVTPQFKKGKFEAGIVAGTEALIKKLGNTSTGVGSGGVSAVNPQDSDITDIPQSPTNNPFINWFLVLVAFPLWKFIILPFTRLIYNFISPAPNKPSVFPNLPPKSSKSKTHKKSTTRKSTSYNNSTNSTNYYSSDDSSSSSDYSSYSSNDSSYSSDDSSSSSSDFGGGDSGGGGGGDDW